MKKFSKIFVSFLIVTAIFVTAAIPSFALPINSDVTDSYNYNYLGGESFTPDAYRTLTVLDWRDIGATSSFSPVDLLAKGDYLYVVDAGGNSIIILDKQYKAVKIITDLRSSEEYEIPELIKTIVNDAGETVTDTSMLTASQYSFNGPQGIFVDDDGNIYVADTGNRRIVVCNSDGVVSNVIQGVEVSVLGATYVFQPTKLVVDAAGGINVLAYGVNRGIMVLDDTGEFRQFTGAPNVSISAVEWFWRLMATEEQKAGFAKYVPTEYSNITVDSRDFTYATISAFSSEEYAAAANVVGDASGVASPIKRLSSSGVDTLRRKGRIAILGDRWIMGKNSPQIVDVSVNDKDIYTMLDRYSGRFFTYGPEGDLLYVGGGYGTQSGKFTNPNSIAELGDDVIVSDGNTNTLTVFERTQYAKTINNAIVAHNSGKYDDSKALWSEVLTYNSRYYLAYIGMGKAEMRKAADSSLSRSESIAHYQEALEYFEAANETTNYSKAYKELQKESMSENFVFIAVGFVVIVVGCIVLYYWNKARKKKKLKAERGGKA